MFVEPEIVSVKLYRRDERGMWNAEKYEDLDDTIDLREIGSSLPLRDVYDTLDPRHRPRLQVIGSGSSATPG